MKKLFLLFNIILCASLSASQDISSTNKLTRNPNHYKENAIDNLIIGKNKTDAEIEKAKKAAFVLTTEKTRDCERRAARAIKMANQMYPESIAYRP